MESIEIRNLSEDFVRARDYIEGLLMENRVTEVRRNETMLIFEALCYNIFEDTIDRKVPIIIRGGTHLGDVTISLTFEGPVYASDRSGGWSTPEDKILSAFGDRIAYSYRSGYNRISISVRRSPVRAFLFHAAAILLAVIVYAVLRGVLPDAARTKLLNAAVFPLEELFTNLIIMIGAPVTFFSMLKNLTDTYIVGQRSSIVKALQKSTVLTSFTAIVMGTVISFIGAWTASDQVSLMQGHSVMRFDLSHAGGVDSLIPSSIFEPFETISPFPLIVVAVLVTYAFCSIGKYFDNMKIAVDACYELFSRMLSLVMFALPFFTFDAFLDMLLRGGFSKLMYIIELMAAALICMTVMGAFYAMRLKLRGADLKLFAAGARDFFIENLKINSAIDAAPFNIRYCARNFGMNRRKLEESLPVLAQTNLDGNCFMISMIALILIFVSGGSPSLLDILIIDILVFFLSLGAPNQPGTMVIGMMIIFSYAGAVDMIAIAICSEVFLGGIVNLVNVTGDIVTAAVIENKLKASENGAE